MATTKTKPTGSSVAAYIAARGNAEQRKDAKQLMAMLKRLCGKPAKMWGPSIVGFDKYRYTYESGHSGEAPQVGFAIRGRELVVYIAMENTTQQQLLAKLGKHRRGKVCLYVKRLEDIDTNVLEQLVKNSLASVRARYGALTA